MSSSSNPRKRPAPGSAPTPQQMPQQQFNADMLQRWNANNAGNFVDNHPNGMNPFMMTPQSQSQYPQGVATPSNALARRGMPNALVPANRNFSPQNDAWPDFGDGALLPNSNSTNAADENDNLELLEKRAQQTKQIAQTKRKQIPPFVQKLNSFLEESKNTDLIRWSEKGDSFIVLDEDEFAKTLIPELFKHNNYASFVRQLNMYGFHKKVGLSDNSMKASERKNKSPSEYYNPYFKRGHPILLWLINKPKSGNAKKGGDGSKKKQGDGDGDSDDEIIPDETLGQGFNQQRPPNLALPAPESGSLQRKDLALVRDQMATLQQQQKSISAAITRLGQEHHTLFQQAVAFQNRHDRHENSINAILNFLGNVFRKSVEEQGDGQSLNGLFSSIIPNLQMAQNQSGSVMDLGDWPQQQAAPRAPSPVGTPRKMQKLLPPIPGNQASMTNNYRSREPKPYSNNHQPQMGSVTELTDSPAEGSNTQSYGTRPEAQSTPEENMMRFIQDANASNMGNSPSDLPEVVANSSNSLTDHQRDQIMGMLSEAGSNGGSNRASRTPQPTGSTPSTQPPTGATPDVQPKREMSLSPNMQNTLIPASVQQLAQKGEEIERLKKQQNEQEQKLGNLASVLGPLSPSGQIPGLSDPNAASYFGTDDIDINQYIDFATTGDDGTGNEAFDFDTTDGFDDTNIDWNAGAGTNIDFGVGSTAGDGGLGAGNNTIDNNHLDPSSANRVVETNTPSQKPPSPSGTEEIPRDDLLELQQQMDDSPTHASKRRRHE